MRARAAGPRRPAPTARGAPARAAAQKKEAWWARAGRVPGHLPCLSPGLAGPGPASGFFMQSKVRFLGHPVHQQLVTFPIGMLAAAVVLDLVGLVAGGPVPVMAAAAYWVMALGIVAALVAAPFGLIDLLAIPPDTRAARIGRLHGIGNLVVVALFAA